MENTPCETPCNAKRFRSIARKFRIRRHPIDRKRVHPFGLLSFIFLADEPLRTAPQALPGHDQQVKDGMPKLAFQLFTFVAAMR
jgi:hypothetical protein